MTGAKWLAVLGVVSGFAVAGCSSSPTPKNAASPSSTSTSTSRMPVSAPTTVPPASSTSIPAVATECTSSKLSVSLGEGNGAAGTIYYPLTFTNTGATTCTLEGYPGISLVGSHGNQIGSPAGRAPSTSPTVVTLAPSQSAVDTVSLSDALDTCSTPQMGSGLRVYPPNQTAALFAPSTAIGICTGDSANPLMVYPFGDNQFS